MREEIRRYRERSSLPRDQKRFVASPPSISLITPNLNCVEFIERTLNSVLDQRYPSLEYVVVDGGSTDGSQSIFSSYRGHLSDYISEPDNGHAHALNKGFALTTGEIMGWLNSDDLLLPGALWSIGEFFAKNPDVSWMTGQPSALHIDGTWKLHKPKSWSRYRFLSGDYRWIQQESTFWRRSLWDAAGGCLDESLRLAVDFDLWVRFFRHAELYTYELPLAAFRYRNGQRSVVQETLYEEEAQRVLQQEHKILEPAFKDAFRNLLPEKIAALSYDEVSAREPTLSICDPPRITVEMNNDRPESTTVEQIVAPSAQARLFKPDPLTKFKGLHQGERCFIVGNGPSLNQMNLDKLGGEVVFGCNNLFLLFDRVGWRPKYYTCVDSRVLPDRAVDIESMLNDHPEMVAFFPAMLKDNISEIDPIATRSVIRPSRGRYFFREQPNALNNLPYSMFSYDIDDVIVQPYTVSITMLQIAAYMGFSEIYLIGCDTDYQVPKTAIKSGLKPDGEIGLALESVADNDFNHFDPRYFGAGRKWHDPQIEKMIEHHKYAKEACDLLGIKVLNATVGGKLEVYPRVDYTKLFDHSASRAMHGAKPERLQTPDQASLPKGYSVEVAPSVGKMWYSKPAHLLNRLSPKTFRFLQIVRRRLARILTTNR